MKTNKTMRRIATATMALAAITALAGCSQINSMLGTGATRDEDGQVAEAGQEGVFSLKVGDCMMTQSGETITDAPVVPCKDAHDEEIYASLKVPDGDYPGDDAIQQQGFTDCGTKFTEFIGLDADTSKYDYWPMPPTKDGWEQANDREILCVAYADDESQVTGSLKGINQ